MSQQEEKTTIPADSPSRIVSGMRPTGPLHLGHFFGVLKNFVAMQDGNDCYYFIADWHALTTEYTDPSRIKGFIFELAIDWLAVGLDPERCVIFLQSDIKEHVELHLFLSMVTPVSWLERNPTYKEMAQELANKDLSTYGFLGYPVLQAADILIYRPDFVPVGQDQLPHLELSREIARRFNYIYGQFFPEPQAILTSQAKLPGLDGRKMSKSYGNSIGLGDDPATLKKKIGGMLTCTKRMRLKDPGEPKECNLFPYHELLISADRCAEIGAACRRAEIGCGECKKLLTESLSEFLEPIRIRRAELKANPKAIREILNAGGAKARVEAAKTMDSLRQQLGLW